MRTPKVEAQQSFEQLMKSDETIQYTLTPRSVREMDVSLHFNQRLVHIS